jgi:regulator of replication initiation timing
MIFSSSDNYEDSANIVETIEKHRRLQAEMASLTEEWENLSLKADKIKHEFEEEKKIKETRNKTQTLKP